MNAAAEIIGRNAGTPEQEPIFYPTPERIAEFTREANINAIRAELQSVEGRSRLVEQLTTQENVERIRTVYPDFDPEKFRQGIDLYGETLRQEADFMQSAFGTSDRPQAVESALGQEQDAEEFEHREPSEGEDGSMLSRAWKSIRDFPKNHPVISGILVFAALVWGISKLWGSLGSAIPVPNFSKDVGAALNKLGPTAVPGDVLPGSGIGPSGGLPGTL